MQRAEERRLLAPASPRADAGISQREAAAEKSLAGSSAGALLPAKVPGDVCHMPEPGAPAHWVRGDSSRQAAGPARLMATHSAEGQPLAASCHPGTWPEPHLPAFGPTVCSFRSLQLSHWQETTQQET